MRKINMINKQVFSIILILLLTLGLSSCKKIEKVENNREFPNTVAENAIVSDKYSNIANQIKDFAINEYMDNISKIPRESGDDEKILNYIYDWAKNHNITVNKASNGCVYYDVPATQGCESFPNIILQAHVDMVNTTSDPAYIMRDKPIDAVYDKENENIHTKDYKTNNGIDDAQGIVTLMALAENKNYCHGPLRMLFTYDEEIESDCVKTLSPEIFNADYLINVDFLHTGTACVSAAGSYAATLSKQYEVCDLPNDAQILTFNISKLLGGHSGADILKNRLNANIVAAKILKNLVDNEIGMNLINLNGGTVTNCIASRCSAAIGIKSENIEKATRIINDSFNSIKRGTDDENALIEIETSNNTFHKGISFSSLKEITNFILSIPNGCLQRNNEYPNVPYESANLGTIELFDGDLIIKELCRSNDADGNNNFDSKFHDLAQQYNVDLKVSGMDACWPESENSSLRDLWLNSCKDGCNIEGCLTPTHGCLECSGFLEKNPSLKMIAIGMDLEDEHMVTETLHTKSMAPFYSIVISLLEHADSLY